MKLRNSLLLLLAALIWGIAFVFQTKGMDYIGPFTFNFFRQLLSGVVMTLFLIITRKKQKAPVLPPTQLGRKDLLKAGLCCGALMFAITGFQQLGLLYTTAGKAGFITSTYILFVPVLGLLIGRRTRPIVWLALAIAMAGLYFLCLHEQLSVNRGDVLTLFCALANAVHILCIGYFAPKVDTLPFACCQFFVSAFCAGICMLLFETPDFSAILAAWVPLLYTGILSGGVSYTLQIIGQKGLSPAISALLLGMESVFAAIGGWLFLQQAMNQREILGCVLMFIAIVLAEAMPERKKELPPTLNQPISNQ